MKSISIFIKRISSLLPYLLIIFCYFLFVNIEAKKDQNKDKSLKRNIETKKEYNEDKLLNRKKNSVIEIPVIPYKP